MMNRKDELEEENGYCDIMAASFSDFLSLVAEPMNGENGALMPSSLPYYYYYFKFLRVCVSVSLCAHVDVQ